MREFVFQLLNENQVMERQKEPCADDKAARAFARQIAKALQEEGWLDGTPGAFLPVLDERGKEIFKEPL
jgi:hypothetical protein